MVGHAIASARSASRRLRPWHVRTSSAREPGGLRIAWVAAWAARRPKSVMHDVEQLDSSRVPRKSANNAAYAAAEPMEKRGGTKGNAVPQSTVRTQSRKTVSRAQARIREAVNRNREGETDGAPAPRLRRLLACGIPRVEEAGSSWHRSGDVRPLRGEPRGESERPSPPGPDRSVSSVAVALRNLIGTIGDNPQVTNLPAEQPFSHRHRSRRLMDLQPHENAILHQARSPCLRLGAGSSGATLDSSLPRRGPLVTSGREHRSSVLSLGPWT